MANQKHLNLLKQGSSTWNAWRAQHKAVQPNLSGANLKGADLSDADLSDADLSDANLSHANLMRANLWCANLMDANLSHANLMHAILILVDLSGQDLSYTNLSYTNLSDTNLSHANLSFANLSGTSLYKANLSDADLSFANLTFSVFSFAIIRRADTSGANLSFANLSRADLSTADLSAADLSAADLSRTILVGTNLSNTTLKDCRIYGISAWDVQLEGAEQLNLKITPRDQPTITVDNLKIAQFIYLLLNNEEIRDVINTLTTKSVLILGRFTPERKAVLDALREALRQHNYLPILFDFEKPASRDITETISTLAHLALFIIADLTEPSSIPKELEAIVPTLAVPVQPLLEGSTRPYAMFKDYWKYQWVLDVYRYNGLEDLLTSLTEHVIEPAERKGKELAKLRVKEFEKQ